jgi:hypothetical protein
MRAGNYFTVTVSHLVLSLVAAAGEWVVSEGRTRNREYGFVSSSRLLETENQNREIRSREGALSILRGRPCAICTAHKSRFPTLPTDLGNRCGDYHIPTATTTTGMNISRKTTNPAWGQFRRAKGAKSSRRNQSRRGGVEKTSTSPPLPSDLRQIGIFGRQTCSTGRRHPIWLSPGITRDSQTQSCRRRLRDLMADARARILRMYRAPSGRNQADVPLAPDQCIYMDEHFDVLGEGGKGLEVAGELGDVCM